MIMTFVCEFAGKSGHNLPVACNGQDHLHVPDNRLMEEFMERHYPMAIYTVLHGDAEDETTEHFKNKRQNALMLLGAYRRNTVSRWFHTSTADVFMLKRKTPRFTDLK